MDLISRDKAVVQLSHNKTGNDDSDVVVQHDIATVQGLPSAFEGMTKREVIEALFPNIVEYNRDEYHSTLAIRGEGKDIVLPISFLDSPYKGVSE